MIVDSLFMQELLLREDSRQIFVVAQDECRRRRCYRSRSCILLACAGDALSCMAPSPRRSSMDRVRQIYLGIFRGSHPFIYRPNKIERKAEDYGLHAANRLLPKYGPERAQFEVWLVSYLALAVRRRAGEFDPPSDINACLAEVKVRALVSQSLLEEYSLKWLPPLSIDEAQAPQNMSLLSSQGPSLF
jgi:hypothetical protein